MMRGWVMLISAAAVCLVCTADITKLTYSIPVDISFNISCIAKNMSTGIEQPWCVETSNGKTCVDLEILQDKNRVIVRDMDGMRHTLIFVNTMRNDSGSYFCAGEKVQLEFKEFPKPIAPTSPPNPQPLPSDDFIVDGQVPSLVYELKEHGQLEVKCLEDTNLDCAWHFIPSSSVTGGAVSLCDLTNEHRKVTVLPTYSTLHLDDAQTVPHSGNYYCGRKHAFQLEVTASPPCDPSPCLHDGDCFEDANSGGGFHCKCFKGYSGNRCETAPRPCNPSPCLNNGSCLEDDSSTSFYFCRCPEGFSGDQCEVDPSPCDSSPCENGGSCAVYSNNAGQYLCDCPNGYSGDRCEVHPSPCDSSPCENGGSCAVYYNNAGQYLCDCPNGYSGDRCEVPPSPCDSSPCQNGVCSENTISASGYFCQCFTGYLGNRCETAPCIPSPCLNSGQCYPTSASLYFCNCSNGYTGHRCEDAPSPCESSPCQNGVCSENTNSASGYFCQCFAGYKGNQCVKGTDQNDTKAWKAVLITIIIILVFILLLGGIYIIYRRKRHKKEQNPNANQPRREIGQAGVPIGPNQPGPAINQAPEPIRPIIVQNPNDNPPRPAIIGPNQPGPEVDPAAVSFIGQNPNANPPRPAIGQAGVHIGPNHDANKPEEIEMGDAALSLDPNADLYRPENEPSGIRPKRAQVEIPNGDENSDQEEENSPATALLKPNGALPAKQHKLGQELQEQIHKGDTDGGAKLPSRDAPPADTRHGTEARCSNYFSSLEEVPSENSLSSQQTEGGRASSQQTEGGRPISICTPDQSPDPSLEVEEVKGHGTFAEENLLNSQASS